MLSPVVLFLVLVGLLYLPPVQNWAIDKVAEVASEKLGMQISVGHVQLSFPLDLVVDDFNIIHDADTIAAVEHMIVDVQLRPLFDKRVVINQMEVTHTRLNTNGFIDAARVKGDFQRLFVTSRGIDLDSQMVEVNGARLEEARIDVLLSDSVPEDTTKTQILWKIHADSVTIARSDLALHMPADTIDIRVGLGTLVAREVLADLGEPLYRVGSMDWTDGALRYNEMNVPKLSLHTGPLSMQNDSIHVPSFHLKTPDSDLQVNLHMPLSFTDSISPGQMAVNVDAQIGRRDLTNLFGDTFFERWPLYPMTLKGQVKGNMQMMEFSDLDVSLPTAFAAKAEGFVANLNDMNRLRADVQFEAQMQNMGFVMANLPRDIQRNYRLPAMTAEGRVKADGPQYSADVIVREGKGSVWLNGNLDANAMRYDAHLKTNNLNVHHFMPHDSIYTVTADLTIRGQGTDFLSPQIGRAHV